MQFCTCQKRRTIEVVLFRRPYLEKIGKLEKTLPKCHFLFINQVLTTFQSVGTKWKKIGISVTVLCVLENSGTLNDKTAFLSIPIFQSVFPLEQSLGKLEQGSEPGADACVATRSHARDDTELVSNSEAKKNTRRGKPSGYHNIVRRCMLSGTHHAQP